MPFWQVPNAPPPPSRFTHIKYRISSDMPPGGGVYFSDGPPLSGGLFERGDLFFGPKFSGKARVSSEAKPKVLANFCLNRTKIHQNLSKSGHFFAFFGI